MDVALFALRIVIGLTFVGHGAQKLLGALGGQGPAGTAEMFDKMGLRPGWLHARVAGAAELVGGAFLVLGLLTPFAAAALIGVMTAAVLSVHLANGFWNTNRGFEYNLLIVAVMFALATIGAGTASLDNALGLNVTGLGWGIGALAAGLAGGASAVGSGRIYPAPAGGGRARPTAA